MLIALDYDETYTRDPELWQSFISLAHKMNHIVICTTMRYEHESIDMCPSLLSRVKTIFTGRKAKREFLQSIGYIIDIWIDDKPDFILFGAI